MRILLAGGGTGGPVAPLLAVADELKRIKPDAEFLFVGTNSGLEQNMVEQAGYKFESIPAAKLRRYFSLRNIIDIFVFGISLVKAYSVLNRFQPDVIFSVGGFVAVPIAWVAKIKKCKIVIHQQDAKPGLANKLISPVAQVITTVFAETAKEFATHAGMVKGEKIKRVEWVGNPVRKEFFDSTLPYKDFFKLHDKLPILLIMGGATGAKQINDVVGQSIQNLVKSHQVVHITGKGKKVTNFADENYHTFEFVGRELPTIMKMAHLVVSRAGLSTISELSVLGKVAIVVPMPESHQEFNGQVLKDRSAAVVLNKEEFTPEGLTRIVNSLKFNVERQQLLSRNIKNLMPKDAPQKIAQIIIDTTNAK